MKFSLVLLALAAASLLHVFALDAPVGMPLGSSNDDPHLFAQILDHFNGADTRTFQQRYWINDKHVSGSNFPVFLYICGEGECSGSPTVENDAEPALLAQKYGGLLFTLEHRYYGDSSPFDTLTTENLQFLSSKQAISDLAYFRGKVATTAFGADSDSHKWVIIGGSYSGALSAWSRIKFPHLYVGAVSSSGVVNTLLDFVEFDEQIAESAGSDCAEAMRAATAAVEAMMATPTGKDKCLAMFSADGMDDGDFYYLNADTLSLPVQYGYQDDICVPLIASHRSGHDMVETFANFTKEWFYPHFSPEGAKTYSTEYQQDTRHSPERNARQWWYQKCSELAYFQNAPSSGSIRSKNVNMEYHRNHCATVFGISLFPDTEATDIYYGADEPASSNIFFANGSQDPWQRAAVQKSLSGTMPEDTIECHNCGHCVDLRGCPGGCENKEHFEKGRQMIADAVGQWLA